MICVILDVFMREGEIESVGETFSAAPFPKCIKVL